MRQRRRVMAGVWLMVGILAAGVLALRSPRQAKADSHKGKAMKPPVVLRVVYQGAKHLREEELSYLTGVVQGMPLKPLLNQQACQKIVGRLRDDGRPFATCQLLKGADPKDTEVIFRITEGPVMKISEIRFEGNTFVTGARLRTRIHSSAKILGLGGQYHGSMVDADVGTLKKYYRDFGFHDVAVSHELQYAPDGQDLILTFHIHEGLRYRRTCPPLPASFLLTATAAHPGGVTDNIGVS